jgi:hypothetical protein
MTCSDDCLFAKHALADGDTTACDMRDRARAALADADAVGKALVLPSPECSGYAPWQPPFRYNIDGQLIEDSKGQRMLDLRGWGYLTGKGLEALNMDEDAAAKIQDDIGKRIAEILTADAKAHKTTGKAALPARKDA